MIINRLKGVWKKIISPNQASFVPRRRSIENIVVCEELIHFLQHTKASNGGFVFKLYLEKAYDRMEWRFIEDTLRDVSLLLN